MLVSLLMLVRFPFPASPGFARQDHSIYVNQHSKIHVRIDTYKHIHTHVYIYIYIYIYMYIHKSVDMYRLLYRYT